MRRIVIDRQKLAELRALAERAPQVTDAAEREAMRMRAQTLASDVFYGYAPSLEHGGHLALWERTAGEVICIGMSVKRSSHYNAHVDWAVVEEVVRALEIVNGVVHSTNANPDFTID